MSALSFVRDNRPCLSEPCLLRVKVTKVEFVGDAADRFLQHLRRKATPIVVRNGGSARVTCPPSKGEGQVAINSRRTEAISKVMSEAVETNERLLDA